MRALSCNTRPIAVAALLTLLCGAHLAAAAAPDACAIVPQAEVARIIGADVPIAQHQPPVEKNGVATSACYYQLPNREGVNASLTLMTFPSQAAAVAELESYRGPWAERKATIATETVAGLPATTVTLPTGFGQIWVMRGNLLIAAGVTSRQHGKATPMPEQSRALLVVALKAL